MRLIIDPIAAAGPLPVRDPAGGEVCRLWAGGFAGDCAGAPLRAWVVGVEPIPLPAHEPSEPAPGAIARLVAAVQGRGAIVALANPGTALGPDRIAYADGVRLFGIAEAADEAAWDAITALGFPVWGMRGRLVLDATRPTPAAALSALAYGLFHCAEGEPLAELAEERGAIAWRAADPAAETTVVVRGGYEAERLGAAGRRADRGNETTVRLVVRSPGGICWTQPRFVAPARPASPPFPAGQASL